MAVFDRKKLNEEFYLTVDTYIKQKEMLKQIIEFYHYKNANYFAELAYNHYQAFNGKNSKDIYIVSTAIELLVLSLDILDDLEDEDNTDAPWMKIDKALSLNISTALLTCSSSKLLELSVKSDLKVRLIDYFLKTILKATKGQHCDLLNESVTEKEIINVIKEKSGSLTALASVLGSFLATGVYHNKVEEYATNIGIAAQVENDLNDLLDMDKSDLHKKKKTLALYYLFRGLNKESIEVSELVKNSNDTISIQITKSFEEKIQSTGVVEYMELMNKIHINRARAILRQIDIPLQNIEDLEKEIFK